MVSNCCAKYCRLNACERYCMKSSNASRSMTMDLASGAIPDLTGKYSNSKNTAPPSNKKCSSGCLSNSFMGLAVREAQQKFYENIYRLHGDTGINGTELKPYLRGLDTTPL